MKNKVKYTVHRPQHGGGVVTSHMLSKEPIRHSEVIITKTVFTL